MKMAKKPKTKQAPGGLSAKERRRLKAIADVMNEATGESDGRIRPRRRDDHYWRKKVFPGVPEHLLTAPPPRVDALTKFIASVLRDGVAKLASGVPHVPRGASLRRDGGVRPGRVQVVQKGVTPHRFREFTDEDVDALRRAFRAWVGVEPEAYWEVVLEAALTRALYLRAAGSVLPGHAELEGLGVVALPGVPVPTAAEVLAEVKRACLEELLPNYLTSSTIAVAFEVCTFGRRGGGPGNARKQSVSGWIKVLKRTGSTAPKAGSRPARRRR